MRWSTNPFVKLIFFGNYFYGICTVALSIEASLQQQHPPNIFLYYVLLFSASVIYYTKAYLDSNSKDLTNVRSVWYIEHKSLIHYTQIFFISLLAVGGIYYGVKNFNELLQLTVTEWLLILMFPFASFMYYGFDNKFFGKYNLRKIGWLKPFIIGFAWAGLVTIYPIIFSCVERKTFFEPTFVMAVLFVKNFMFISVLCIMFDVKDYADDQNQRIKTFVVEVGLHKTIFYILIPLCILGLGSFVLYAVLRDFSTYKILINIVPFISLITVAYSLHERKSIFYYLVIIDGLMLVKAVCGIIGMTFF